MESGRCRAAGEGRRAGRHRSDVGRPHALLLRGVHSVEKEGDEASAELVDGAAGSGGTCCGRAEDGQAAEEQADQKLVHLRTHQTHTVL